jgi:HSP20 family protein
MSTITRWEPVREMITLRDAMDRLFDDAFTRPINMSAVSAMPVIDMYQDDENVVVKAQLPGLSEDDVQISVTDDILTLRGEFKQESEEEGKAYHIREQRYGSFERTIPLPTDVQVGKAKALFEKGILTITLPKAEKVKPKTINIKAK